MKNKLFSFLLFLALFSFTGIENVFATRYYSTATGNWNSAVWANNFGSPDSYPDGNPCSDSVVISAGHTITVDPSVNISGACPGCVLVIRGTLHFGNGRKLTLPCGSSVYIAAGGSISYSGGGSSNLIESDCPGPDPVIWNTTSPSTGPVTLPVTLLEFNAFFNGEYVSLNWSTGAEINNNFFEIQRSVDAFSYAVKE